MTVWREETGRRMSNDATREDGMKDGREDGAGRTLRSIR